MSLLSAPVKRRAGWEKKWEKVTRNYWSADPCLSHMKTLKRRSGILKKLGQENESRPREINDEPTWRLDRAVGPKKLDERLDLFGLELNESRPRK